MSPRATYRVLVTDDDGGRTDPDLGRGLWSPVEPGVDHLPVVWTSPVTPTAAVPRGAAHLGRRVVAGVVAAVVLAVLAVGTALPHVASTGSGYRTVAGAGAPASGTVPGSGSGDATPAPADDRDTEIAALLARRGDAVASDDASVYAATQTTPARTPLFGRLEALPLTMWDYRIQTTTPGSDDTVVLLDVRLHLRLDVDATDAVVHEHLTVTRGAAGWRVSAESTADRRAQPWDLGDLTVVHGSRSLVIGIDTPTSDLRGYTRLADAAVPAVSDVWGSGWSRHPVVLVPRTTGQLARALARTARSLDGYAAVTTGELSDGGDRSTSALRIWLNAPSMSSLSAVGRQVVVRHEITHVATDAPGTPGVPLWLEEGFAEYVGYRDSSIALGDELRELATAVRAGRGPSALPTRATFQGSQVDLAYEGGDLACRVIADRYGQQALVQVYRLTAAGTGTEAENLEAALRAVTRSGTASLESAWRARLSALAG